MVEGNEAGNDIIIERMIKMLPKKLFAGVICSLAMLAISLTAQSQENHPGYWDVVNGELYLGNKWNLWGEVQLRSQELTDQFYYHELKGG